MPKVGIASFLVAMAFASGTAVAHDDPHSAPLGGGGVFLRGDANLDGKLAISDAVRILSYLYLGGVKAFCLDAMDADDSGDLTLTDAISILSLLFLTEHSTLPPPYPEAGTDRSGDDFFCDNGRFGRLRRELFEKSCTAACHSIPAAAGGLILEGYRAYSELVRVPAANPAAQAGGLLRVKPGDPAASFFFRKLTGQVASDEGHGMADIGLVVPPELIDLARHWITDAASPSSPEDIKLPPPARGDQILIPSFDVDPGSELQRNYYFKLSNPDTLYVNRVEILAPPGNPHLNFYRSDARSRPHGDFDETFSGVPFASWSLVATGQNQRIDWVLPPGVALKFSPFQQTLLQAHFVNVQNGPQRAPIGGCACLNLHAVDPATVTSTAGTLFIQNRSIELPPGSETTWDYGVTLTRFRHNATARIAAVAGDFHWRGKVLEARRWDGLNKNDDGSPRSGEFERMGIENRIYFSENWREPVFQTHGAAGPELPRGWGVVYRTTFVNDRVLPVTFGPYAATHEHANLVVYFYPGPDDGQTFSFPLPVQQ